MTFLLRTSAVSADAALLFPMLRAAAFGVDPPRVAMLSYSTGASGSGAEVEKVGGSPTFVYQACIVSDGSTCASLAECRHPVRLSSHDARDAALAIAQVRGLAQQKR